MQIEKSQIREAAKIRRAAAFARDSSAGEKLLNMFPKKTLKPCTIVAGYMPIGTEIDPKPLMVELEEQGARFCLPRVNNVSHGLDFYEYEIGDELETSNFGVLEPFATRKRVTPNWLLVPLLAFDRNCNRLGYGKGFYDAALANLKKAGVISFGIAYAAQEFDDIPIEQHDEPLDFIITEITRYQALKPTVNSLEIL